MDSYNQNTHFKMTGVHIMVIKPFFETEKCLNIHVKQSGSRRCRIGLPLHKAHCYEGYTNKYNIKL